MDPPAPTHIDVWRSHVSPSAKPSSARADTTAVSASRGTTSPPDDAKHFDSSDNSDVMDDGDGSGKKRNKSMSKNLMSERNRRRRLNERLYALRALVPNISKMDKASIVRDAINYICNLQRQVNQIQSDIASLKCQKEGAPVAFEQHQDLGEISAASCHDGKVEQEHWIIELEVSQMQKHIYSLHVHCKKSPGVILQLSRVFEAMEVDILNANVISIDDQVLNTCVVKVRDEFIVKTDELRSMALEVISQFGFIVSDEGTMKQLLVID